MAPSIPVPDPSSAGGAFPPCCQALLATVPPDEAATCANCGAWWSPALPRVGRVDDRDPRLPANDDRPTGHVDVVTDCEVLAAWLPVICGRSTQREPGGGGPPRNHGERADHVDDHHRDRKRGLRRALVTLGRLDLLERAGHERAWRVLWLAYVRCGPVYRLQEQKKAGGLVSLVARTFASAERQGHWEKLKHRSVRDHQVETFGIRLLTEAHERYEDVVHGVVRVPQGPEHPVAVARQLDELFAKAAGSKPGKP